MEIGRDGAREQGRFLGMEGDRGSGTYVVLGESRIGRSSHAGSIGDVVGMAAHDDPRSQESLYNVKQESVQFFTKSSHTESKFPQTIDSPRDQTYHISEPSYPPRDANAL